MIQCVHALRSQGVQAYLTIDAGPNVKVLTTPQHERAVIAALRQVPGVEGTLASSPGLGARLVRGTRPSPA